MSTEMERKDDKIIGILIERIENYHNGMREKLDLIQQQIDELKHYIEGNGKEGLKQKILKFEIYVKILRGVFFSIAGGGGLVGIILAIMKLIEYIGK